MDSDFVTNVVKFNAQTNGRDKIIRLCQYGCRLVWGRLQAQDRLDYIQTLKNIEYMFSMTRKLLRFGKSLDFIQGAMKSIHLKDAVLRLTLTLSKINQALYLLFDHFLWFNNVGAVKLNKQFWGELSARFYLTTLVLNLIRDFYGIWVVITQELKTRLARSKKSAYKNGDSHHYDVTWQQTTALEMLHQNVPLALDTVKNLFDLAIPLSTLGMLKISPQKQGVYGLISSGIAVLTVWNPMLKLVPA